MLKEKTIKKILWLLILFYSVGIAQNWTKHVVSDSLRKAKKLYVADINKDGRFDIIAVASNTGSDTANVVWYENDGDGRFTAHIVSKLFYGARSVWAADITANGYPDILAGAAADSSLVLFKNDGSPENDDNRWAAQKIGPKDSTVYCVVCKDINRDGRQDIIASYYNIKNDLGGDKVRIYYTNGISDDTIAYTIDTLVQNYEAASSVFVDDFNRDGYWDILSCAGGADSKGNPGHDISSWINDGNENFTQNSVSATFSGPWYASTADVNGDTAKDVLSAGWGSGELAWWANDGSGNFGAQNTIITGFTHPRSIQGTDMDGDGDTDILGTADEENTIAWFENDGSQNFTQHTISNTFHYAYFGYAFDMDGDGDEDVLGSAQDDQEIALWESDLAEEKDIAAGDPETQFFNDSTMSIDFILGYSGGITSGFYNHGNTQKQTRVGLGIDHIAGRGFFTIVCHAAEYEASIDFYYGKISEWQGVASNENDLRICYWNSSSGQWMLAGDSVQIVDPLQKRITVRGVKSKLKKYSLFTIGSISTISAVSKKKINGRGLAQKGQRLQNYPNPFNNSTTITFSVTKNTAAVRATIYNIFGQKIKILFRGHLTSGNYRLLWNGVNEQGMPVASGIYFYSIQIDNRVLSKRLHLIK